MLTGISNGVVTLVTLFAWRWLAAAKNNRPLMLAGLLKLAPKAKFEIKSLHCSRWAGGLLKMYNRVVSKGSEVFCITGVVKIIVWC